MRYRSLLLFCSSLVFIGLVEAGQNVIAYYTAWAIYGRNYQISSIPAQYLTHINYAFANIDSNLLCTLGDPFADTDKSNAGDTWDETKQPFRGNFWQLNKKMKEQWGHLKTLISVGGWTWSARFSDAALSQARRQAFAKSCVDMMVKYGFDGVDIDCTISPSHLDWISHHVC